MSQNYEKMKTLLKELFQLDQPDLDFGLYRIMHAKSAEITQFLEQDLLPQVKQAFGLYKTADRADLQKELGTAIDQAHSLGADPETMPKVQDIRDRLANDAVDLEGMENEVYDHLFSFFRRYYSDGDFLARRVYKPGVYAIPYEGEEVKLHWANQDQYYIKTSEYLRDYAFRLKPNDDEHPMSVHFRLADATEGEHGNVKNGEGKDRLFVLAGPGESGQDFIVDDEEELSICFEYRSVALTDWPEAERAGKTKAPAQKDLLEIATKRILAVADTAFADWIAELSRPYVTATGEIADYTRLEANLRRYAARNTFDYFIHKDLGTFLRRELDFYIKNEVMHLDDVESETTHRVEQYLSKIKVIRRIGGKIIEFLGQLEDFQKALWLKKKFVIETQYCITLDRIADHFYPGIATNDAQREEWVRLFAIDEIKGDLMGPGYSVPLTVEFLKAHPQLTIDTRHFEPVIVEMIIQSISSGQGFVLDGLCVMSENFQALSLLSRQMRYDATSIYIDPPYNTDASPIIYKNGYPHSSWLSLIDDRLEIAKQLLSETGILCITIDDAEEHNLRCLTDVTLSQYEVLGVVPIKNNPAGRTGTVGFSVCHEYAIFYGLPERARVGRLEHSEAQKARYKEVDDIGSFEWTNFRKHGGLNTYRTTRPRQFYPIYVEGQAIRIPEMQWDNVARDYKILDAPKSTEEVLLPIDDGGRERIWDFVVDTARANIPHFLVRKDSVGATAIYRKWRLNDKGLLPQTWWDKSEYSAAEYGTNLLTNMFGETHKFTFPKSIHAVTECLKVSGMRDAADGLALDYFAGSGTTGHAVIALNRADGGSRSYVLVEMAEYFDSVLLPRLRKAAYAPEWKDGKPRTHTSGISHLMKYIRLESFEDTLNNLETRRTVVQQSLLDSPDARGVDGLAEQFVLRYMLDVETRASQSRINLQAFQNPVAYKLKVKVPGSDENREVNVDLLETFNWLTGLGVQYISATQGFTAAFERDGEQRLRLNGRIRQDVEGPWWFRTVTGTLPDGRQTLVIWRKLTGNPEQDNLVLDEWFTRQGYSTKDYEFQLIYTNGDNNLENLRAPDDTWKVRIIEEDFYRLMFDVEGV